MVEVETLKGIFSWRFYPLRQLCEWSKCADIVRRLRAELGKTGFVQFNTSSEVFREKGQIYLVGKQNRGRLNTIMLHSQNANCWNLEAPLERS